MSNGSQPVKRERSPIAAGVLSLIVPGAGQVYAGEWRRGLTFMIGLPVQAGMFRGVGLDGLIYWMLLLWAWNVYDAVGIARGRTVSAYGPVVLLLALNLYASCSVTRFRVPELGAQQRVVLGQIVGGMARPDFVTPKTPPLHGFSWSETARTAAPLMLETIYLALLGTGLSLLLALPLSFLAARNLMSGSFVLKTIYGLTRGLFTILRSVEVLIFALIAVVAVGIGPLAGVIALAIHGVGALGKLYSEAIESIEHGPIEAIRATGANEFQVVIYGVVPQVVPQFIAFALYRWDINVRMATIVGLVGGGGIGYLLVQYIQLLQWPQAATSIWMIAGVVMLMDYASAVIRERVV